MKNIDFFKNVKSAEHILEESKLEDEVILRFKSKNNLITSEQFTITQVSYMSAPWLKDSGSVVVEFKET